MRQVDGERRAAERKIKQERRPEAAIAETLGKEGRCDDDEWRSDDHAVPHFARPRRADENSVELEADDDDKRAQDDPEEVLLRRGADGAVRRQEVDKRRPEQRVCGGKCERQRERDFECAAHGGAIARFAKRSVGRASRAPHQGLRSDRRAVEREPRQRKSCSRVWFAASATSPNWPARCTNHE